MGLFGSTPRLEAAIAVDRRVVAPGEEVVVTLDLGGSMDPGLTELVAGITCEGSWDATLGGSEHERQLHIAYHRDLRPVAVALGQQVLRCTVPLDAPPTAYQYLSHTARWVAVVRGRGAKLVHADAPFIVTADVERCRAREILPPVERKRSDAASLWIECRRTMWADHPFEGVVHVRAEQDVELRDVVVALEASLVGAGVEEGQSWDASAPIEHRPGPAYLRPRGTWREQIRIRSTLRAGEVRAVPFSVTSRTDGMFPTLAHPLARIHWALVATAELSGDRDVQQAVELNVASQPSDAYR